MRLPVPLFLQSDPTTRLYGGGQPSGEAHARLKEALVQRGVFKSGLMRRPVLPLNQEEKDWIALGLERSQLPKVDMSLYE